MKVVIPRRVQSDLFEIVLHVAQDNPATADRLSSALQARCLALAQSPDRGSIIAMRRGLVIRRLVEGQYLIVYSVSGDIVRIHRIVHGARSPRLLLRGIDLP